MTVLHQDVNDSSYLKIPVTLAASTGASAHACRPDPVRARRHSGLLQGAKSTHRGAHTHAAPVALLADSAHRYMPTPRFADDGPYSGSPCPWTICAIAQAGPPLHLNLRVGISHREAEHYCLRTVTKVLFASCSVHRLTKTESCSPPHVTVGIGDNDELPAQIGFLLSGFRFSSG